MPPARAPLLALVVLALLAPRAGADPGRSVDRVVRAHLATGPSPSGDALAPGLVAPVDALGLVADGGAPRSGATGAIGPTAYVEAVNHRIAVFDRAGRQLAVRSLDAFAMAVGARDPQIQWDPRGQRWLYAATATDPGADASSPADDTHELLYGFSRSSDPTDLGTGWCTYVLPTNSLDGGRGSDREADLRLGHDDGHVIIAANVFGPSGFRTGRIFFGAKPGPARVDVCQTSLLLSIFGTPDTPLPLRSSVPANSQDASPAAEIVAVRSDPRSGAALQLRHIDYGASVASLISDGIVRVPPFDAPGDALQPGGAPRLDTGDGRLSQAVAHTDPSAGGAEAVWTTQTIAGADGRSVVRWYEILPASATVRHSGVRRSGVVRDGDEWLFDGAISPTRVGDAAVLLLTAVGRGAAPSLRVLARTRATPEGRLAGQRTLDRSADTFACATAVCPWAPSAAASPDPLADRTVWGTTQLAGVRSGTAPAWTTRNVALIADVAAPTITLASPPRFVRRGARLRARYSCADEAGGSGMTSCAGTVPRGARVDTRLGRHRFTVRARDRAGHLAVLARTYVVDGRGPVVTVRAPARGAVLRPRARLVARYSCRDERGGSGVASCRGSVRAGRRLNTSHRGGHALVVTATDRAGHRVRLVRAYRVG